MEKLLKKKGFLCDMDGVIYHGNKLLPGVKEFLNWLKENDKHYLFLTNSSERTPKELQQKLARLGLDVDASHFCYSTTPIWFRGQTRKRILPTTCSWGTPKVGGHSAASTTARRPEVPAPM